MNPTFFRTFGLMAMAFVHASAAGAEPFLQHGTENGEFTAELNGLKLWYRVSGTGPVCLMPSPPWGPSSDLYFHTMKPLEKIFTVVYLDSRGTGRSQRAPSAQEYTWELLDADLDALRLHLQQDKVWLMGHSQGGMLAMHYSCRHPDRVNGLVLLATQATLGAGDDAGLLKRAMRRKDESWFPEALKTFMLPPPTTDAEMSAREKIMLPAYWADPARFEKYADDFAATSMSAVALKGVMESKRFPFDVTKQLTELTAPTLIVAGDKDLFCPPTAARQIHLCLRNSKLLIVEDCGHFPWMEQAEEFNIQVPKFLHALGL